MSEEELKRIIFQAHGQDAKALEFMQTQIAALTAKLARVRTLAINGISANADDRYDVLDEILREVGR
jgi:recombinational DNA repair ATPase RecF